MASHQQLDASGRPSILHSLICYLAGVLLLFSVPACSAESRSDTPDVGRIEQLFEQQRWQEIVADFAVKLRRIGRAV